MDGDSTGNRGVLEAEFWITPLSRVLFKARKQGLMHFLLALPASSVHRVALLRGHGSTHRLFRVVRHPKIDTS
jgi:hypothetical protein